MKKTKNQESIISAAPAQRHRMLSLPARNFKKYFGHDRIAFSFDRLSKSRFSKLVNNGLFQPFFSNFDSIKLIGVF